MESKSNQYIRKFKTIRIFGLISSAALMILIISTILPVYIEPDSAESATPVASETTITIAADENVNLDMIVSSSTGTFASSSEEDLASFSVTTNNYTGYTLSISGKSDNDDNNKVLVNNNTGDTLSSITDAVDSNTFSKPDNTDTLNKWGFITSRYNSTTSTYDYLLDGNYQPAPTKSGFTLDSVSTAGTYNYKVGLGAKIDYTKASGVYNNTYNLTAVANPIAYTIYYYDGINADSIGYQSGSVKTTSVDIDPTYISGSAPVRDTYTFRAWCLGRDSSVPVNTTTSYSTATKTYSNPATICNGTEYQNGDSLDFINQTIDTNELNLYAVWAPTTFASAYGSTAMTMQKMTSTICGKVSPNQYTTLTDERDNQGYTVGKLEDNRCWMADNLNIDLYNTTLAGLKGKTNATDVQLEYLKGSRIGTATDQYATSGINSVNSTNGNWNSSYSYSVPLMNRRGFCQSDRYMCLYPYQKKIGEYTGEYSYDTVINLGGSPSIASTGEGTATIVVNIGPGNYKIGSYYNFCAASAGSYCWGNDKNVGTGAVEDAVSDICPSGWRLPVDDVAGEIQSLYSAIRDAYIGSNDAKTANDPMSFQTKLSTPLSGQLFDAATAYRQGTNGYFWSATNSSNVIMYGLYIDISTVLSQYPYDRYTGRSIRCIAQN